MVRTVITRTAIMATIMVGIRTGVVGVARTIPLTPTVNQFRPDSFVLLCAGLSWLVILRKLFADA